MFEFRKIICMILVLSLATGFGVLTAGASEDPMAVKDYEQFGNAEPAEQDAPAQEEATIPEEPAEETAEELPAQTEPVVPSVPAETSEPPEPEEETVAPEPTAEATEPTVTEEESEEPAAEEGMGNPQDQDTRKYKSVPLYFQTDYPDVRFGSGTVSSNGCSVTCLAMVATYMTGHEYLPDELARYFGGKAENNIARLELGSEMLQLTYQKAENWHEAYAALQDGKIVIVLVDNRSAFTQSQHFVIMTGINKAGKITVLDSYEPNYEKWELKTGFQDGFTASDILCGYSGAWIYDVDAMPEEPFIYSEPELVRGETRYPGVELTDEEMELLARVVWAEARGESGEGQQAVAEVVLNRLASDRFPNTLNDVVYGEGQFRSVSVLKKAKPHQAQYEAVERALYGPYILPEDVYYFATFPTTDKIWGEIGGHIFCYAQN